MRTSTAQPPIRERNANRSIDVGHADLPGFSKTHLSGFATDRSTETMRPPPRDLAAARAWLASAYALKGETQRVAAELAEARRLSSDGRFSNIARLKAAQYFGVRSVRALYEATYLVGLRKAGMPEG
jgi:hypothetical protein